ncbi:hypothetical protein SAMN05444157_0423 [Frankineae bacterium MT45]|nr:hypothetical protein SAMN05444157_0423 [Frankineae bacterium MT45]
MAVTVLMAAFKVWAAVVLVLWGVLFVLFLFAPNRLDRFWLLRGRSAEDGRPQTAVPLWFYLGSALGVGLPAAFSIPIVWRINPTDRDNVPLHQDPSELLIWIFATFSGIALLVTLPMAWRHDVQASNRLAMTTGPTNAGPNVKYGADRADNEGVESDLRRLLTLLLLVLENGRALSIDEIYFVAARRAAGAGNDRAHADRAVIASDVVLLVELGMLAKSSDVGSKVQRWQITAAGRDYLNAGV